MKMDSSFIGVAAVIIVASVAGDFDQIGSIAEKTLAYIAVSLAPSFAVHFRRRKQTGISNLELHTIVLLNSALSLAIALSILYLWRGNL